MKVLREREATAFLNLPKGTLANLRSRGEAPPWTRVGAKVVYLQEDLEAWITQRIAASTTEGATEAQEGGDV